jgi:glycosyltransferase involved in cell wall biosynthesis
MLSAHRLRGTWTRDVDRYIAPTEFVREKMIEGGLPPEKITVKPHFLVNDPGMTDRARDGFLFVGRIVDYKGVALLPIASSLMPESAPIRIIGDGPLAAEIEKVAATDPAIHYLGRQPQPTVSREMKAAIALLVPSINYETFGLTIAEAYACGTPVIASRHGAMAELIKDGETGLLFDPGDASDLAAKITWACQHQEEMRRMGGNARRKYEKKFTPERNYRLLMDIYRDAIAHSPHRATQVPVVRTMTQQGGLI